MNKIHLISTLKIVSILVFLSISIHGPHVSIPFGFVIIISVWDFFENINSINLEDVVIILDLIGLILVLYSIKAKKNYLSIIGYLLTYIMLFGALFETNVLQRPEKNTYFFITSSVYFIISIYIIHDTISSKKAKLIKTLTGFLLLISCSSFGQKMTLENWNENEKQQYNNLVELVNYIQNKNKFEISKDTLFDKYIYFDYVLKDSVSKRKERRLTKFDTIFYYFIKTVDSLSLKNLDAKPIRFYKKHKIYKPFDEKLTTLKTVGGKKMYTKHANVFAYYNKEEPENPLGVLQFEGTTNKLGSWIFINQGGYHYFLTFSLL